MTVRPHIAVVGDYDATKATHRATSEEISAAGAHVRWMATDAIGDPAQSLSAFNGLVLAPGGPYKSISGAIAAIRHARVQRVPLIAMCSGFQHVALEAARKLLGIDDAEHAEINPDARHPAVTPLTCPLVGRQGKVRFDSGSRVASIYGCSAASEPYYCNYGLNPELETRLAAQGLSVTGRDEQGSARVLELEEHPFLIATLFVFQVRPDRSSPHPLTRAFLDAAGSHTRESAAARSR